MARQLLTGLPLPLSCFQGGVFVSHLLPSSVSARSGKIKLGDCLVEVNGREFVAHAPAWSACVSPCSPYCPIH